MKIKILSALLALAASSTILAAPIQLVTNGGFETGTLSGWTTSGLGTTGTCPSANRDWNVSSSGGATGCVAVANPTNGTYAAYVMGDGTGPLTYRLFQNIVVPDNVIGGSLSFDWARYNFADNDRSLNVLLDGINVFSSSTYGQSSWTNVLLDVSAILSAGAGTTMALEFDNYVPRTWTGGAGLGIDRVSVSAAVPEPTTIALLGLGLLGFAASRRKSAKNA